MTLRNSRISLILHWETLGQKQKVTLQDAKLPYRKILIN